MINWISCKDRLPELSENIYGRNFLVALKFPHINSVCFDILLFFKDSGWQFPSPNCWHTEETQEEYQKYITHWAVLNQPE